MLYAVERTGTTAIKNKITSFKYLLLVSVVNLFNKVVGSIKLGDFNSNIFYLRVPSEKHAEHRGILAREKNRPDIDVIFRCRNLKQCSIWRHRWTHNTNRDYARVRRFDLVKGVRPLILNISMAYFQCTDSILTTLILKNTAHANSYYRRLNPTAGDLRHWELSHLFA